MNGQSEGMAKDWKNMGSQEIFLIKFTGSNPVASDKKHLKFSATLSRPPGEKDWSSRGVKIAAKIPCSCNHLQRK